MRFILLFLFIIGKCFLVSAQKILPEWIKYTSSEYIYDFQSDINNGQSKNEFLNNLTNNTRVNLAKQLQVNIKDVSSLNKETDNGHSSIKYSSSTIFHTDIDLQLVNTKTFYDINTKKGYVISYINKNDARNFCKNEIIKTINNTNSDLSLIDTLIKKDSKFKAKEEIDKILNKIEECDKLLIKLNLFGVNKDEYIGLSSDLGKIKKEIKDLKTGVDYGTILCIICNAEIFGEDNLMFNEELKGLLADPMISFTNDINKADWIIRINANTRKFNFQRINSQSFYFTMVDSKISIYKSNTSQLIYENKVSTKGGHTINYNEAAIIAYSKLNKQLSNIIIKHIKQ